MFPVLSHPPFVIDPNSQRREELARVVGGQALSAIGSLPPAAEPDDVAILCTVSRAIEVEPDIRKLAEAGYNVVTTCEELAYPDSKVQADLNGAALTTERVIAATGANPGFVMDRLVVLAARAWCGVERITVVRRVDTSRRRDSLIAKTGAGLDRSAFEREVEEGRLGHVRLRESAEFVASSLGWNGKASVTTEPYITDDGGVTGLHQLATIESNGGTLKSGVALRSDTDLGPTLLSCFDARAGSDVIGLRTIADIVDESLPGGLVAATDEEIAMAADAVIDQHGAGSDILGLSVETTFDEGSGHWVVPALVTQVVADNEILGFATAGVTLGTDTAPEEYSRDIVSMIRGDQSNIQAWGIAVDINLTSQEQGQEGQAPHRIHDSGCPRHRWHSLSLLLVDSRYRCCSGRTDRVAIWHQHPHRARKRPDPVPDRPYRDDLVWRRLTFHALGRYQEERRFGHLPRRALTVGMSAVIGALVLALVSDTAAFLSNVSSGIESIIQFGVATSSALVAAFFFLGVVTPLTIATIEQRLGTAPRKPHENCGPHRRSNSGRATRNDSCAPDGLYRTGIRCDCFGDICRSGSGLASTPLAYPTLRDRFTIK